MVSFWQICCGEGEEETKFGAYVATVRFVLHPQFLVSGFSLQYC